MDSWEALKTDCADCRRCALCEGRTHLVFGVGNEKSPLLFVGEGPGEQEDRQGEPFVGAAGKLLDDMLELMEMDRQSVYIANVIKCRPPRNRDPLGEEISACREWLERQIALIHPRVIVCLGRFAAMALIGPDFRITRDHGRWYEKNGVKYMALYHPSALLRDESKRPETFADMRELRRVWRELRET